MAKDKTIISIPPLYFYQYAPNTAANFSELTYNEGIYLKSDSLSKTYPKSVARIYKNPNKPNKIYLISKDSSILQAISKYLSPTEIDTAYLNQQRPESLRGELYRSTSVSEYSAYFNVDADTLESYSVFAQPTNIADVSYDDNSLVGKTINFYTLSDAAIKKFETDIGNAIFQDFSYDSATTREWSIEPSYLLRAKSISADYSNDKNSYSKGEAELFMASLFQQWTSDKYSKVSSLVETDLELKDSFTIKKTRSINFNDYIEQKYENLWVQKVITDNIFIGTYDPSKVDVSADSPINTLRSAFTNGSYLISVKYTNNQYWQDGIIYDTGDDSSKSYLFNWTPLYGSTYNKFPDANGELHDYTTEKLSDIRGKNIVLRRSKLHSSNNEPILNERELDVVPDEPLDNFLFFNRSTTMVANITSESSTNVEEHIEQDSYLGSFKQLQTKIFNKDSSISFSSDFKYPNAGIYGPNLLDTYITSVTAIGGKYENIDFYSDITETRYLQEKSINEDRDLTTMYILNDQYTYSELGFVPDDLETIIYEIELDEEINIQQGSFIVVEIE